MVNRLEEAKTACLMQGMTKVLGTGRNQIEQDLGEDRLEEMVATCRNCTKADACILWLVDHQAGARRAPDFCLNGDQLTALADRSRSPQS